MGRVTDDERREIAENLRYDADYPGCAIQYMEQFISMLRETVFNDAICDADYSEIFQRLADLIEPGDMSHVCRDTVACDREALLALADEMGHPIKQAVWNQTAGMRREHIMAEYVIRIRGALGVTS